MIKFSAALFCIAMLAPAAAAGAGANPSEELLDADQAFQLSTRVVDGSTLEASWKITPGYYLYRNNFRFESLDSGVTLAAPQIPSGKKKQDPLFGMVETHSKSVLIRLPIVRHDTRERSVRLRITAQGCNEPVGVCYPPMIKEVSFNLPAVATTAGVPSPALALVTPDRGISLKDLTKSVKGFGDEPVAIDPEQAFLVSVNAKRNTLHTRIDIADCCYLYRDKTNFELSRANGVPLPAGVRLGAYRLPVGTVKTDEFNGQTEVYHVGLDVALPVEGLPGNDMDLQLTVNYQGCSEKGVTLCYPPNTKVFQLRSTGGVLTLLAAGKAEPSRSAENSTAANRDGMTFIFALLTAFGAGLLLTFTPCVLPMIPILSSIIVGKDGKHISQLRGGLLSYSYVLGTAVTYTIAGVLAGLSGEHLQAYFQNLWAIGLFSLLLVLLALSLFGFYELQMPSFIQSHLHRRTHQVKGGSLAGAFFLGMVSALIVGACVSPILISVLGAAIAAKDPLLGGALMLALAHGQGAILVAFGIGAGFLLPKAGPWMDRVKHFFGVLLLAVAIYLLGYLPQVPVLFLWAALLVVSAIYLGATQNLPEKAGGWRYLQKGIGTFLLIWGALALLGGFAGNRDILNPLPLSSIGTSDVSEDGANRNKSAAPEILFERVHSLRELDDRLIAAKAVGKPVILDFFATWCTDCVRMEKTTFANARVRAQLQNHFVLLQVDVTDPNHPEGKAIKQRFGVYGPPAMLFFAANGEERLALRAYGFRSVDELLGILGKIDSTI